MGNILFQYCEILYSSPHQFLRLAGKKFGRLSGMPKTNFEKLTRNEPTTTKILIEKMCNREIAAV
jgi:hypothetical protein